MRHHMVIGFALIAGLVCASLAAEEDAEGCKDYPLFNRFPNTHIGNCKSSQFDLRRFPVGPPNPEDNTTKSVDVEGPTQWLRYEPNEGTTPLNGLQVMRNFENAAKKAGGTVEGEYPEWCKAGYDSDHMPDMGNGCTNFGVTLKFLRSGKEVWAFVQYDADGAYVLTVSQREAMKQDISVNANELLDKINKEGFVALYINFDTGKATIKPDSMSQLDQVAQMLKSAPNLKLEVGGHTDNVGTPESNQKLSEDRAKSVVAALVSRSIAANRLTPKGYGQTAPIADNRTEEGRAKNRRVELAKR